MKKRLLVGIICISTLFLSGTVNASSIAIDWTTGESYGSSQLTRGWAFSTNIPITVTDLGFYDFALDGLDSSHQVGIWDSGGSLLISGTVAAGTLGSLVGDFRYTNLLTGVPTLAPGNYVIGGLATREDYTASQIPLANISIAPGISYIESRANAAIAFSFPNIQTPEFDVGYFGPNFQFNPEPIPEPTTMLLLGTGLAGVAGAARRKKKD